MSSNPKHPAYHSRKSSHSTRSSEWEPMGSTSVSMKRMVQQRGSAGLLGERILQRRQANAEAAQDTVHNAAQEGLQGAGGALPFKGQIQEAFGQHSVEGVQAHVGGAAQEACEQMGAEAYATGESVAFRETPTLHTAAHEAAHVIQQRGGVQLKGGVGQVGDVYEVHADAVADAVVQGRSAETLLDPYAGDSAGRDGAVQMAGFDEEKNGSSMKFERSIEVSVDPIPTIVYESAKYEAGYNVTLKGPANPGLGRWKMTEKLLREDGEKAGAWDGKDVIDDDALSVTYGRLKHAPPTGLTTNYTHIVSAEDTDSRGGGRLNNSAKESFDVLTLMDGPAELFEKQVNAYDFDKAVPFQVKGDVETVLTLQSQIENTHGFSAGKGGSVSNSTSEVVGKEASVDIKGVVGGLGKSNAEQSAIETSFTSSADWSLTSNQGQLKSFAPDMSGSKDQKWLLVPTYNIVTWRGFKHVSDAQGVYQNASEEVYLNYYWLQGLTSVPAEEAGVADIAPTESALTGLDETRKLAVEGGLDTSDASQSSIHEQYADSKKKDGESLGGSALLSNIMRVATHGSARNEDSSAVKLIPIPGGQTIEMKPSQASKVNNGFAFGVGTKSSTTVSEELHKSVGVDTPAFKASVSKKTERAEVKEEVANFTGHGLQTESAAVYQNIKVSVKEGENKTLKLSPTAKLELYALHFNTGETVDVAHVYHHPFWDIELIDHTPEVAKEASPSDEAQEPEVDPAQKAIAAKMLTLLKQSEDSGTRVVALDALAEMDAEVLKATEGLLDALLDVVANSEAPKEEKNKARAMVVKISG